MPTYVYNAPKKPSFLKDPISREGYEADPRLVFTGWMNDARMPRGVRDRMGSYLFDNFYANWQRNFYELPDNQQHAWFSDYLYGQSAADMDRMLSQYSYRQRGIDPRQFGGKVRWVGF